jgi:hypothetical protein
MLVWSNVSHQGQLKNFKTIPQTKKHSFKREDKFIRKKMINKSISM